MRFLAHCRRVADGGADLVRDKLCNILFVGVRGAWANVTRGIRPQMNYVACQPMRRPTM